MQCMMFTPDNLIMQLAAAAINSWTVNNALLLFPLGLTDLRFNKLTCGGLEWSFVKPYSKPRKLNNVQEQSGNQLLIYCSVHGKNTTHDYVYVIHLRTRIKQEHNHWIQSQIPNGILLQISSGSKLIFSPRKPLKQSLWPVVYYSPTRAKHASEL
jgi:hypothetical protein